MTHQLRTILLAKEKIKREEKFNIDMQHTVRNVTTPQTTFYSSVG
jgi:hypothetical protein